VSSSAAIPSYAVDLLMAAKSVANPPSNASAQYMDDSITRLQDAVIAFESSMPVIDGVVQESDK